MEHEYRIFLEKIHTPEGLNDRVMAVARETTEAAKPVQRGKRPVWRMTVCAALAVVLVLGGISLRPMEETMEMSYEFGLTAYAADERAGANGGLLLGGGDGEVIQTTVLQPEKAQYTDYRFQIHGENLQTLTLTLNRGGLYCIKAGENLTILPKPAVEEYDPDVVYGLWVPPQEWIQGRGESMLDGAELTVTARFTDGTEQTNVYRLTVQRLLVSENEDGTEFLIPALKGSDQTGVSGLYLEPLNSVWFQWPVQGSNTISLSNAYGYRWNPGGETRTFHAGIDIPASQGAVILAAADGTVIETGFDSDRGNYLVLDHGDGLTTVYAQCRNLEAKEGDTVKAGEIIAAVGSTGKSTGPHLCFQVWQDGEAQNPVAYFDSEIRDTLKMG